MFQIYFIGSIIAFCIGTFQAYQYAKKGESIDDYPIMIVLITFLSWIYILLYFLYIKKYITNDSRIYSKEL